MWLCVLQDLLEKGPAVLLSDDPKLTSQTQVAPAPAQQPRRVTHLAEYTVCVPCVQVAPAQQLPQWMVSYDASRAGHMWYAE